MRMKRRKVSDCCMLQGVGKLLLIAINSVVCGHAMCVDHDG